MDILQECALDQTRLTPAKRALLEMRLKGNNLRRTVTSQIGKRPEGSVAPLSFAQQRLWFLYQMAPGSAAYNMPAAFRLEGILDSSALAEAFNQLVCRHEVLRTTFTEVEGEPVLRINPASHGILSVVDLKSLGKVEQDIRVKNLADKEARRCFDLKTGPLIRARLLKLTGLEHVLLVTLHHIVCDGWSMGIFAREIVALYDAIQNNQSPLLSQLPIQYADFAYWQRQRLQGEMLAQQLEYWRQKLSDIPVLDFPTDYTREVSPGYEGASQQFVLTTEITSRLKMLSNDAGVTLFTTLFTTFSILLQRYTGQSDIVTGTVIANRNRVETEGLIGFFVNALPLRLDLSGNPTFQDLLSRANQVVQEAFDHQDLPFDRLVQDLRLPRDTTRNPVFQVSLALDNTPQSSVIVKDLRISALEINIETIQFDLTVHFNEQDDKLIGLVSYNRALFSSASMQRLSRHLENLFEAVVNGPNKHLCHYSILTGHELRQLTVNWNGAKVDRPHGRCIHELFEIQANNYPDAIAVTFKNERLTYAQLNAKANQLARYLRNLGVGPETIVGICIERSLEMIIGILATLKAGAGYLPIDPNYPKERREFLLVDADPVALLTQTSLLNGLSSFDIRHIYLDQVCSQIVDQPETNLATSSTPSNLAYIIYTSGSTGKPKGVVVSHQNIVHSTLARFTHYKHPVERFLLLPSFAFDSSIAGIFWTLSQGGCLCMPQENMLLELAELVNEMSNKEVTHLLCLPSFYQLLLDEQRKNRQFDSLRTVIVAGEACSAALVKEHYALLPEVELFNEYGPTEGTVWATGKQLRSEDSKCAISIGHSIDNVEIYLLDASLNLIPPGVKGEIYIGGEGLARGYLNRAALTADRFIPHPFNQDGNRLYKTGDLARFQTDGSLEFLGRADNQVKIRGFRIELGEIEAVLMQQQQVKEAVVLMKAYAYGDTRLVAYCIPASVNFDHHIPQSARNTLQDSEDLKNRLKAFLPEYMVPSIFVFLDQMPLTPNGKIDRNKLLIKDIDCAFTKQYVPPRNETEAILIQIWSEILGPCQIGIHDDFFEMGGHSILTVQVIRKINTEFNLNIPVTQFFKQPTVARLADIIDKKEISFSELDSSAVDLANEANLDWTIQPNGKLNSYVLNPKEVFLTGATGFLGAFLLYELLQQTLANVHCLVRAKSDREAYDKLKSVLEQYGIFSADLMNRVIPVCGDLSRSQFGLASEQFNALAEQMEAIYHNGALVNFVQSYSTLKATNVLGTQEVLRFACIGKIKPVHYVSTLSVFGSELPPQPDGFSEDYFPESSVRMEDGYSQSKWVAEQLMRIAKSRGVPVTIHRPATVTGHSVTGVWNADDFLCRLIRGCIDVGEAPILQRSFDIAPVDYVSKAIVYLSIQSQAIGKTFHYCHKDSVMSKDVIAWINAFGCPVLPVSYAAWRETVMAVTRQSTDHPLYPLLAMFQDDVTGEDKPVEIRKEYSTAKTEEALSVSGIQCPAADRALFDVYLSCLQRNGMIAQPPDQNDFVHSAAGRH